MATTHGRPSASSRTPIRDLVVAVSVDLLRAELNGSGLARSWNTFRMTYRLLF
ncbi:MAG: hypothetical protein R3281_14310 [Balneolaceae bacterium]|nr:hypothetical protein [Balneolaceae bacterium]